MLAQQMFRKEVCNWLGEEPVTSATGQWDLSSKRTDVLLPTGNPGRNAAAP